MQQSIDSKKMQRLLLTDNGKEFYGASQSWYPSYIKQMSGCAPTAASNLLACADESVRFDTLDGRLEVMQTMWSFVRPGRRGVNRVQAFARGSDRFFKKHRLPYRCLYLGYGRRKKPPYQTTVDFIKAAFANNCPVAFLNLSNGDVQALESWHWVTVVRLTDDKTITVYDGDRQFDMDLSLWHATTDRRGGFAYYKKMKKENYK